MAQGRKGKAKKNRGWGSRVGAGVGHGQETGNGVVLFEVFVRELLAVYGLATSTLFL